MNTCVPLAPPPVHRHAAGHAGEGAAEQIHAWPPGRGHHRHTEVPALRRPRLCHPQCGDGLFKEEKVSGEDDVFTSVCAGV